MEKKCDLKSFGVCEWFALGVMSIALIGLAAYLSPMFRSFMTNGATASWAAAVATTSAAGIALWLGLRDGQRLRQEKQDRASVVGWLVIPWLGGLVAAANTALRVIEQLEEAPNGSDVSPETTDEIAQALDLINPHHMMPFTLELAALGKNGSLPARSIGSAWRFYENLSRIKEVKTISPELKVLLKSLKALGIEVVVTTINAISVFSPNSAKKIQAAREASTRPKT